MADDRLFPEIIEVEDSDSESDFELIDDSSTSKSGDDHNKKRKIVEIEDSSDEDFESQLRELSVQSEGTGRRYRKNGKQRARESSPAHNTYHNVSSNRAYPSTNTFRALQEVTVTADRQHALKCESHRFQLIFNKIGDTIPTPKQTIFKIHGIEEHCVKIMRNGFTCNNIEYQVDDAIILPHNPPQYALIRFIFTLKFEQPHMHDRHFVHVHYLKTSSNSRSGELFLKHGQCQSIPIKQILKARKLNFEMIGGRSNRKRSDAEFFCQFVDQPAHSAIREPTLKEQFDNCDSCYSRHEKHKFDHPRILGDTLTFGDEEYHLYEFILIDPTIRGLPFIIGQVKQWRKEENGLMVRVRRLKRFGEVVGDDYEGFVSKHRLIVTYDHEDYAVPLIMGKAYVVDFQEQMKPLSASNSFWCCERLSSIPGNQTNIHPLQKPLKSCLVCLGKEQKYQLDLTDCLKACRFPASDYYSGAGGFLLPGLDIFKWVSAVDTDKAACQTLYGLRRHAGDLRVHRGKVSELYTYTTSRDSPADNPKALPAPGTVFLMTGGPPCQGHSRVNHANNPGQPKDIRNDELWVMLAEVFRVLPYVVIIENVSAFKDDKAVGAGVEELEENYGRSAMKELSRNGYSCRLGLIDSRLYGTPQNRLRTFILGVRSGLPLPEFPTPTHSNSKVTATIFKNNKFGAITPFYIGQRNTPGTGIHSAITIKDAISDLPGFEILSPYPTPRSQRPAHIPVFDGGRNSQAGNNTRVGFTGPKSYCSNAMNDFQLEKRKAASHVKDQYCSYVTDGAKQIIFEKSKAPNAAGCDRRATFTEGFSTLLTNSSPGQKGTAVIHPIQNRKFTIAERKRAMGWPDWHKLAGTPLDQDRLTGNGVCYESVHAIYMSLVEEIILPWWIEAGRPTQEVFAKFKNDHP